MNILITGANGFIGSNLMNLLSDIPNVKLFKGTRETIDLYSRSNTAQFVERNNIDVVIHCAISGGRRTQEDPPDIVYKNILMFNNLIDAKYYKLFINIGSGAEYDRKTEIFRKPEYQVKNAMPTDYYGFSKNIISRQLSYQYNTCNLRLFGCFYHNESPDRMIRNNIERYIKGWTMHIHEDKYMDFFYLEDLATVIKYVVDVTYNPKKYYPDYGMYSRINPQLTFKDLNMSYYGTPPKLSDIANFINTISERKSKIFIEYTGIGNSYCGDGTNLELLKLPLKGWKQGIIECYDRLKQ